MSKYVDLIAWDDCPHLQPPHVSQEELDELEASLLPHQRQARRTGRPALGSGAIYPVEEDSYLIDPIPIPAFWGQAYGMDVGWRCTAALFTAHDPEHDIFYLTGEYYEKAREPVVHAHSIKAMQPSYPLMGAIDPAAEQSNQKDGTKLKEEYEALGLELELANNAVEAGLHRVLVLLQSGRLKVFNTLTHWLKEVRLYRRDEKGRIVKDNDHLMDAMRYVLNTDSIFRAKPVTHALTTRRYGEW